MPAESAAGRYQRTCTGYTFVDRRGRRGRSRPKGAHRSRSRVKWSTWRGARRRSGDGQAWRWSPRSGVPPQRRRMRRPYPAEGQGTGGPARRSAANRRPQRVRRRAGHRNRDRRASITRAMIRPHSPGSPRFVRRCPSVRFGRRLMLRDDVVHRDGSRSPRMSAPRSSSPGAPPRDGASHRVPGAASPLFAPPMPAYASGRVGVPRAPVGWLVAPWVMFGPPYGRATRSHEPCQRSARPCNSPVSRHSSSSTRNAFRPGV